MILDAIASVFRNTLNNPAVPLSDVNNWGTSSGQSLAGPRVGREQALCLHAVWRAVDLISDSVGKLPCFVYQVNDEGKDKAKTHPAYNLIRYQPNNETTAFKFRKTMEAHRLLQGNAYAYIRRLGNGQPFELIILDPENVWPVRVNGTLYYVVRTGQTQETIAADNILHLTGLGYDGLCGYPVTHKARDSFGLGLATNEYAAEFFRNGAEPRVIISTPGNMPPDAQTVFLKQWQMMHGEGKRHSTAIVTGGGKVEKLSIDAQDAQLIEQRKFTIIEIANWFGIPPHKLGDSSRTAYNSLEQENQSYLDECLDARLVSWEEELRRKLLTEQEKKRDSHLVQFDRKALVRADLASRAAYLEKAIGGPWMTVDEGRFFEDMNARPGDEGDVLYGPQTQAPAQTPRQPAEQTPSTPAPDTPPRRSFEPSDFAKESHRALLARSCQKMAERIAGNSKRRAKDAKGFMDWLDEIADHSRAVMVEEFKAPLAACAAVLGVTATAEELADTLLEIASRELLELSGSATADGLDGAVNEWAKRFSGKAAEEIAAGVFNLQTNEV